MPMKVKAWFVNVLLMVVSISIIMVGFEFFLVYDDWHADASDFTSEVTLNGTTYRFIESASAINQAGTAVLIAGDSFTAGSSCADHRTYPSAFTKAATRHEADLHAINMGLQGTGPISYALRIKDYLTEKGKAAGAILTLYANDVEIDCEACRNLQLWSHLGGLTAADRDELAKLCRSCLHARTQRVSGEVPVSRRVNWWLADHLRSYLLLREAVAKLALRAGLLDSNWGRAAFSDRWRDVDGIYFRHVRAAIELAKQETDLHSIPMMVVIYPDPTGISQRNEYVAIYDHVRASLENETAVPVYSGYDAFLGNDRAKEDMRFSLTDTHPSCEAHDIFGEWVFQKWGAVHEAGPQ